MLVILRRRVEALIDSIVLAPTEEPLEEGLLGGEPRAQVAQHPLHDASALH